MAPIIETILSLVFIFLVFSLITSWIVEFISAYLQRRQKMLRQYIVDTLNDRFNKNWGLLLYAHPLIEVLHHDIQLPKGFYGLFQSSKLSKKRRLPAYIPSEQFASALIDLIIHHQQTSTFVREEESGKYVLQPTSLTNKTYQDFLAGLESLNESETKITLATLVRRVQPTNNNAINELTQLIAAWYDNGMDRLNGRYKQATRKWLFMMGLLIAVCFNVNTLVVVNRLYVDPQLRTAVSQAAESYLQKSQQVPETYALPHIDSLKNKIADLRRELEPLNLPIGWNISDGSAVMRMNWDTLTKRNNILGWFLTALALSFGAPFWFDALKNIANVRSVGRKPGAESSHSKT